MLEKVVQDLTVKGESIERVYSQYTNHRYLVNRAYQRKLVWTMDEKIHFIDSIMRGYPVPILILAESPSAHSGALEIIDGMQRLNTIVTFIENDYMVDGGFFDLNTMAVTKAALDAGKLLQHTPVLSRDRSVQIASYEVPFSIYKFAENAAVDEVFRRINAGGRKLSRQELRASGSTGHFAQVVRKIAAKLRGDDSQSDILLLNEMKKISITNRDLAYGIAVEGILWVNNGILTKEQVRESRDEELIADIVAYMVSDPPPSSRSEFLDDFFSLGDDDPSRKRYNEIESGIQKRNAELVIQDFQRTFDQLAWVLDHSGKTFSQLIFTEQTARAPRYFQMVFLAYYYLVVMKRKVISDIAGLTQRMAGSHKAINVPEGGRWGAEDRRGAVEATVGVYQRCFVDAEAPDPTVIHWVTQLQNILAQSYTEQSYYDLKQGLLRVDNSKQFDENSFHKILKTCVGIANLRKGARGYVVVGVADKAETAKQVKEIFGVDSRSYERFFIVGVEHEAVALGKNLDQLFQWVIDKIRASEVSADLKEYLGKHLKLVRYYEKSVFVFEVQAQVDPSHYGGAYYIRRGTSLGVVEAPDLGSLFRSFIQG